MPDIYRRAVRRKAILAGADFPDGIGRDFPLHIAAPLFPPARFRQEKILPGKAVFLPVGGQDLRIHRIDMQEKIGTGIAGKARAFPIKHPIAVQIYPVSQARFGRPPQPQQYPGIQFRYRFRRGQIPQILVVIAVMLLLRRAVIPGHIDGGRPQIAGRHPLGQIQPGVRQFGLMLRPAAKNVSRRRKVAEHPFPRIRPRRFPQITTEVIIGPSRMTFRIAIPSPYYLLPVQENLPAQPQDKGQEQRVPQPKPPPVQPGQDPPAFVRPPFPEVLP